MLAAGVPARDWVLVHDAARCLVTPELIDRLIDTCQGDNVGGLLAHPVADTLKLAAGDRVAGTTDRDKLTQALAGLRAQGSTALWDALVYGL